MAKRRAKNRKSVTKQGDLFASANLYPVRRAERGVRAVDLSLRIKTAMGVALKECPDSAAIVAARMTELSGREISADALYAYTAPSKPEHDMGITRFIAFVRATGATWLWDELLRDDGLLVLEGEEAKLAERGHLEQERRKLEKQIKALDRDLGAAPVQVKRRGR